MSLPGVARILILDSDDEMGALLADQLRFGGVKIELATQYPGALKSLEANCPALLILESKIPEISTLELIRKIRLNYSSEILSLLLLTANPLDAELQELRNAGVNDFLSKPFDRPTLLNKVKALIRKQVPDFDEINERSGRITVGSLTLDPKSFDVFSKGERLHLTPNEFKLLHALLSHPGEILSRDRLIELVQGEGISVIDRAVDTHIFSLRKKLGASGDSIETVRGSGYRINYLL